MLHLRTPLLPEADCVLELAELNVVLGSLGSGAAWSGIVVVWIAEILEVLGEVFKDAVEEEEEEDGADEHKVQDQLPTLHSWNAPRKNPEIFFFF